MKVLVIGFNGQLGWELCRGREKQGFDIASSDIPLPISAQGLPAVTLEGLPAVSVAGLPAAESPSVSLLDQFGGFVHRACGRLISVSSTLMRLRLIKVR